MTDYKNVYADTWAKAAKNVKYVSMLIAECLRPPLKAKLGFAAVSDQLDNSEHNKSEPDILILNDKGQVVAGIEVTGSDRVSFPCKVWVASHKLQFMLEASYPISYVLFYRNRILFLNGQTLQGHAHPFDIEIGGNPEKYHWIHPKRIEELPGLKAWLLKIQTDYFARKTWAKAKTSEGGVSH